MAMVETIQKNDFSFAEKIIRPRRGIVPLDLKELWQYRELFWFLAWRDVLIRYKQTVIGIAWAVVQPLVSMVVFVVVFEKLAKLSSHGAPYAVIVLAALLPWQLFAGAIAQGSQSLVASANMITKVYFPRIIIPASATLSGFVDFAICLVMLFVIMAWYHVQVTWLIVLLPLFSIYTGLAAFGVALWLGALNVKYRDVKHIVPFLVRIGMYVLPVGFLSTIVPDKWRMLYHLNPLVGIIDGFRWAVLGSAFQPWWPGFWMGFGVTVIILVTGAYYFRITEKTFADLI